MKTQNLFKILLLAVVSLLQLGATTYAQQCKEVVGYYPNWQWYDRNKVVNPQSIDYSKYSIINYCFFKPELDGSISSTDPWADENLLLGQNDWANGGYIPGTSIVFQAHSNGVKILPSIGGWTLSDNFPSIAADPSKRLVFANACVNLIQTYGFDGIDLDWEYPGFVDHNGSSADKVNFNLLLQEVRNAIDAYGTSIGQDMILTAAVGAPEVRMEDVDWPTVSSYLDIINVMSYDFFGSWDPVTNHNSPLFAPQQGDPTFNLATSIERLINQYGVDPQKITAGVAFYGRSLKTTSVPALFAAHTGVVDNQTFNTDQGTPLYYNVLLEMNNFDEHWDSNAKVPYLTGKNGLNTFVSYDNEASIEEKAKFIVEKNLRGAIIWEITGDYVETSPGSGIISATPLASKLNSVFCNYTPSTAFINDEFEEDFVIFPNPSNGSFYVKTKSMEELTIDVISNTGRLIFSTQSPNNGKEIILPQQIENGHYTIQIQTKDRRIFRPLLIHN